MGKGLMKFRISRVIPTFHSCRSKDPSTLPSNPVPLFLHRSSTTTTHPKPHRSSIKRHVSSAFLSARQACLRPHPSPEPSHTQSPPHYSHFKWGKIKNHPHWHVIANQHNYDSTPPRHKIYNSAASETDRENDVVFLPPPTTNTARATKTRRRRRRTTLQKIRLSTSSDSGLFTEDDENENDNDNILERETLVSTDSPKSKERENNHHHKTKTSKKKTTKQRPSFEESVNTSPVPARLSEFMRKMAPCRAVVNGKVRESFAMVKRSEDPCEDFKRSMVEMVVEKQMFEERELEELLRCFLSLNSQRHHQAIVKAFTQIWNTVFSSNNSPIASPH